MSYGKGPARLIEADEQVKLGLVIEAGSFGPRQAERRFVQASLGLAISTATKPCRVRAMRVQQITLATA